MRRRQSIGRTVYLAVPARPFVLLHRHLIVVATKLRIVVPYSLALAHGRLTVTRPSLDSAAAVSSLSRKHNTGLPAL